MTGLARIVAFLFGIALVACTFGQWVGPFNAWELAIRGLWRPGVSSGDISLASIGALVCVGALLMWICAATGNRATLMIGALITLAIPAIWLLVNAIDRVHGVAISSIEPAAYGAALIGFFALMLSLLSTDRHTQHVR